MKTISGIYQIKNIKNNKVYIGSSYQANKRPYLYHLKNLRHNTHFNMHLQLVAQVYHIHRLVKKILAIKQVFGGQSLD